MISFMEPTKPDWSGLVLSTQNLSYNSEFVHLPSWYRPLVLRLGLNVGLGVQPQIRKSWDSMENANKKRK